MNPVRRVAASALFSVGVLFFPDETSVASPSQSAISRGICGVAINASGNAKVVVTNNCDAKTAEVVQKLLDRSLAIESRLNWQESKIRTEEEEREKLVQQVRELSEAIQNFQHSVGRAPSAPGEQAQALLAKGDASAAIDLLGREAEAAGSRAASLFRQQAALLRSRDVRLALRALERSLAIGPEDFETLSVAVDVARLAGQSIKAATFAERMVAIAISELRKSPENIRLRENLASSYLALGDQNLSRGDTQNALSNYGLAIPIATELADSEPQSLSRRRFLVGAQSRLAHAYGMRGNSVQALQIYENCEALLKEHSVAQPGNAQWSRDTALIKRNLASIRQGMGDRKKALDFYQQAIQILRSTLHGHPEDSGLRADMASSSNDLGAFLLSARELTKNGAAPDEAREHFQYALKTYERLAEIDAGDIQWKISILRTQRFIDELPPQSHERHVARLMRTRQLAESDPSNLELQAQLAADYSSLATYQQLNGSVPLALTNKRSSLTIHESLAAVDPANATAQSRLAGAYDSYGILLSWSGEKKASIYWHKAALAIQTKLALLDPLSARVLRGLWTMHLKLGDTLYELGEMNEALVSRRAGYLVAERLLSIDPAHNTWRIYLVVAGAKFGTFPASSVDADLQQRALKNSLEVLRQSELEGKMPAAFSRYRKEMELALARFR